MSRTKKGSKGPGWEPWSNLREKQEQKADYVEDTPDESASDKMNKPDDVLVAWDAYIAGTGPLNSQTALIEALREALRERDEVKVTLRRLVNACYPLDMWLGGYWTQPLSEKERKEFVHALSAGLLTQQIDDN